jgi:hypothetical protein
VLAASDVIGPIRFAAATNMCKGTNLVPYLVSNRVFNGCYIRELDVRHGRTKKLILIRYSKKDYIRTDRQMVR